MKTKTWFNAPVRGFSCIFQLYFLEFTLKWHEKIFIYLPRQVLWSIVHRVLPPLRSTLVLLQTSWCWVPAVSSGGLRLKEKMTEVVTEDPVAAKPEGSRVPSPLWSTGLSSLRLSVLTYSIGVASPKPVLSWALIFTHSQTCNEHLRWGTRCCTWLPVPSKNPIHATSVHLPSVTAEPLTQWTSPCMCSSTVLWVTFK